MCFVYTNLNAQLIVDNTVPPVQVVQSLVGTGVTIFNIQVDCPTGAMGTFDGSNSNVGIDQGILLTSGSATNAVGPNNNGGATNANGGSTQDPDLLISEGTGNGVNDQCILEFDFCPGRVIPLDLIMYLVQKNI